MATIFTVNYSGSYGDKYEFKVDVTESSVSTANNTSVVTATAYVRRTTSSSNGAWVGTGNATAWSITIDGTKTSGTSMWDTRNTTAWQLVGTASKTVTHNSDGSKNISIAATHTGLASAGMTSASGSGSMTLTSIPRYFTSTPTLTLQSKTSTSAIIKWATSENASRSQYKINDGSWIDVETNINKKSGTMTVTGLSPNTTYTIYGDFMRADSGLWAQTKPSISVTTHAKTTPTIALSSKTSSSITVTSGCNVTVSSTQYRIKTSSGSYGAYQTSATFSGLSANTTYTIEVRKVGSASGEAGTATINVTTHQKTIPTIALSSKTVNSVTVTSNCNVTASSTQYRIKTASGSYGAYQTSATFSGLSPNTAYTIEVKKVGSASGESGVATLSVTTYQIALLTSVPNFNLGDTETITYSNPSGATINLGIFDNNGSASYAAYRVATGTSYKFTFTDEELDKLYKAYGTGNTITARIYIRTTANNVNYWNYKTVTITLNGNQKTGHINVNGSWKRTKKLVNVNGNWKKCVRWVNINGTWKRCI